MSLILRHCKDCTTVFTVDFLVVVNNSLNYGLVDFLSLQHYGLVDFLSLQHYGLVDFLSVKQHVVEKKT